MTHHFVPFVRFGLATAIGPVDTFSAAMRARVTVPVTLRLNDVTGRDISKTLTLAGPGDVIGIDPAEVVRTEPRHLTPDFPPNLMAAIEFDRPDFPWLFTPAAAQAGKGLRPWIVLAVVRKSAASIRMIPGRPLPTLTCAASELPDLAESWLWAHASYVGELGTRTVADLMAEYPDQSVSRLLCPRRLQPSPGGPDTGYVACVLPAFDVGRRAGLGEDLTDADLTTLAPAWSSTGTVDVPIYYQWEFDTGPEGDFEEAVDRLQLLTGAASTPVMMDARRPDPRLQDVGPLLLPVASALRTVEAVPALPTALKTLKPRLKTVLETPGEGSQAPVYGQWQTTRNDAHGPTPLTPGVSPPWLADLNLDPRYRVAAALGAQVVQQQQEQLVAAAWQQAGEVEAVNALLRQKQLAREVSQAIFEKRVAPLPPSAATQLTSAAIAPPSIPGSSKPASPATDTMRKALVSPGFRRMARPLGSRIAVPPAPPSNLRIVEGATTTPPPSGPPPAKTIGTLLTKMMQGSVVVEAPSTVAAKPSLSGVSGKLMNVVTMAPGAIPSSPAVAMKPYETFKADVQQQVAIPSNASARPDPLAEVLFTPSFDRPMYEPLAELSAQMLLPGLDRLPNNSVLLLKVDPAFVEAYMAGLNDEMSRELLWREFPTSLRGTYFRQFWDVRAQLPPNATAAQREGLRDIPPVSDWTKTLGSNMPASRGTGLFLLLFKGDLLLRFPTALIYAARAKWPDTPTTPDVPVVGPAPYAFPMLRLNPVPGVTMLGFNLLGPGGRLVTPDTVAGAETRAGDPGWFFVIEEHPTEPRFGLDLSRGALTSWRELSWNDVATRPDGHIRADQRTPVLEAPPATALGPVKARYDREQREVVWRRSAADMAYVTMQMPFRLEVHSSFWFRPEETGTGA